MFFRRQRSNLLTLGSSSWVGPRIMASAAIENADVTSQLVLPSKTERNIFSQKPDKHNNGIVGQYRCRANAYLFPCKCYEDKHETRDIGLSSRDSPPFIYALPSQPASSSKKRQGRVSSMARNPENISYQLAKASTAIAFSGSLSVLSSLTLTAVVIGLVAATPLLVIFSPVLVPAGVAMLLLNTGLVTSGGLGATAAMVFYWVYNYVTGQHPVGADKLDQLASTLASGVRSIKN